MSDSHTLLPYLGSGPYCYSNSLAMMLGPRSPSPSVIEVLTGSPFGLQLIGGVLPLFDPYGWDPEIGLDAATKLLGWTCQRQSAKDPDEAIDKLRESVSAGPVLVGPVEMGLLLHQPGSGTAIRADHFMVVLEVEPDRVRFHDPHGHPYATLPPAVFLKAWRGESIGYANTEYTMRTGYEQVSHVTDDAALRQSLTAAVQWLSERDDADMAPGSLGGQIAARRLADMVEAGLEPGIHGQLVHFGVRVGARRLADAASALALLRVDAAARLATRQAKLLGSVQYDLVAGDRRTAAATLRQLASTYPLMHATLAAAIA